MIIIHGMIGWRAVKDVPGEHTRWLDLLHVLHVLRFVEVDMSPAAVVELLRVLAHINATKILVLVITVQIMKTNGLVQAVTVLQATDMHNGITLMILLNGRDVYLAR